MKKNVILKRLNAILFLSVVFFITIFTSCENFDDAAPVITEIRNYAAAPNDTLVTSMNPGQWIVIHGRNLKEAVSVSINGTPIQIKVGLFDDNSAVVKVPDMVPFNNIDPEVLNTITYVTSGGSTTFKFNVNPPPATITGNSLLASSKPAVDSVFVYGTNLYLIESLTIAGVEIKPLKTVSDGSSIGFIFPDIDAPQPWEAVIVAASGIYTFNISIEPEISAVSNVNPNNGDLVRVYGKNLNGITNVKFGGATIANYTEDPDGFFVEFTAPDQWSYDPGFVSISGKYGTTSTTYNVNGQNGDNVGLLANVEWGSYFGWGWYGDVSLTVNKNGGWMKTDPDFDGTMGVNNSMFLSFNTGVLAAGASKYCPLGNSDAGNHWIPAANVSDPIENWGIQFDISVASPWNGGTLYFKTSFAGDTYAARYEPWKISAAKTVDYETEGWQTVTLPLTAFKKKNSAGELGLGDSATLLTSLVGNQGATGYDLTLKNFSDAPTKTGFHGAIDNIRVVKLK